MDIIKLEGKEYPVKFTYSALMELEKRTKKNFSEIAAELGRGNMTLLVEIAFVGMKTAARINKEKFKLTLENVGDLLTPNSLIEVTNLFGESFAPGEATKEGTDKQKKTA